MLFIFSGFLDIGRLEACSACLSLCYFVCQNILHKCLLGHISTSEGWHATIRTATTSIWLSTMQLVLVSDSGFIILFLISNIWDTSIYSIWALYLNIFAVYMIRELCCMGEYCRNYISPQPNLVEFLFYEKRYLTETPPLHTLNFPLYSYPIKTICYL